MKKYIEREGIFNKIKFLVKSSHLCGNNLVCIVEAARLGSNIENNFAQLSTFCACYQCLMFYSFVNIAVVACIF